MKKMIRVLSLLLFFTAMLPMTSAAGYLKDAEIFADLNWNFSKDEPGEEVTLNSSNSNITSNVPIKITAISTLKVYLAVRMTSNETTDKKIETNNTSVIQMATEGMRISTENLFPSTSSNLKVSHTISVEDVKKLTRTTEFNMANAASTDFIKDQYDGKNQYDGIRPAASVTATQNLQNLTTNSYTLKFLDGFGGVISTAIVKYGASISYPEAPTREGMKFAGWDTEIGSTMPDHDVTVTARWTVNSYTLTINGDSKQVDYGTALTAPADPTAEGKAFTGWTWTVGGKTVASMPTTMPAANVTATANWQDKEVTKYTVTFYLDEEEYYSAQYAEGETIVAPDPPVGYVWYSEIGWVMPASDLSIDALPFAE
ncbi:MAG: InlB B-repeat-containing protein [Candidatus Limivivens sp.]|nr:InlB B-repeat-containing protein [Candidatus Limivivens sp.]